MVAGDHPENDESPLLEEQDIEFNQMSIGMARWIVHLGRLDIMFALGCLDRFAAVPREGHFTRVLKIFGYLKKYPNREICANTKIQKFVDLERYECNWVEQYQYAKEEIPEGLPNAYGPAVKVICFVDSDHAHETTTR